LLLVGCGSPAQRHSQVRQSARPLNAENSTLRAANNIDPERDIQFTLGPVDSLDHASRLPNYSSKMGIDATRKWKAEGFERPWPALIEVDRETKARVDALRAKLGL
jgi:4-hydroxy-3-polyprenylbenzoate decarboxylase